MRDVESFIRSQIRRILREDAPAGSPAPSPTPADSPAPSPTPTSTGGRQSKGNEKDTNRGPRVVRGRVGGGNFSNAVKAANSLADKDPQALVKKLKLSGASGASSIDKALSIVRQAIRGADVMKAAYSNAEIMQDERGEKFIRIVHSSEISPRDAAQYMYLVFIAADKVGMLSGIRGDISPGIVKTGQGEIVAVVIK